ncbi:UDP-glucuronosyl/UDP-glucosyltransferase [Artemisia annua]|uniref:UDP-glucuronosyl/UDP-glucosyltransferase n=1 Tax=Artemisia annua TaxID=35608 RepID=A0A2U1LVA3_ARTAN|nr:UDP-glucuronosyl/UDP-glucosyltransferase [Artemisia annua]
MAKYHVAVVPLPAQGHVIPAMELAHRLVEQGVKVTFVNTEAIHQKVVTSTWLEKNGHNNLLQMVSIPDGLEPWEDRNDWTKLVAKTMFQSMPSKFEELIETINKEDNNKCTCIIADPFMGWAIRIAKKMGIKRAALWTASNATLAAIMSHHKFIDEGIIDKDGVPLNDQIIQLSENMPPVRSLNLPWGVGDSATIKAAFSLTVGAVEGVKLAEQLICNSTTELEPGPFSFYPQLLPIGPLLASNRLAVQAGHFWQEDSTCLAWLDQQQPSSVIYIAFGSLTMFNQTQFEELAFGLELSNKPFLWVVRAGMTNETTTTFPNGYMERVGSRGRIVTWAPQQMVLAHPSIACFLSHCGWNSTLEGVTNGLPFLCWPYFSDQFIDESYICDIWKNGFWGLTKMKMVSLQKKK